MSVKTKDSALWLVRVGDIMMPTLN